MYKDGSEVDLEYIQMLFANDRFEDLVRLLHKLIKVEHREEYNTYDYLTYVVKSYTEAAEYRKALAYSRKFTKEFPEDYRCYYDSGKICMEIVTSKEDENAKSFKAWNKRALDKYLKAYSLNPKDVQLYNDIAFAYRNLKDYDNALEWFDKAIEKDSSFYSAYYGKLLLFRKYKKFDEEIAVYESILKRFPCEASGCYYRIGCTKKEHGDLKSAVEYFEKSITDAENHAAFSIIEDLTRSYYELGEDEKVIKTYKYAIEHYSQPLYYLNRLAQFLAYRKRKDEAIEYFKKGFEEYPEDKWNLFDSCCGLGYALMEKEDYKNAILYVNKGFELWKSALEEYPDYDKDNPDILMNFWLISAYSNFRLYKYKEALIGYKEALNVWETLYKPAASEELILQTQETSIAQIYNRISLTHICLNDYEQAQTNLEIDEENQKNDSAYYLAKAQIAYYYSDKTAAKKYYNKVVELSNGDYTPDEEDKVYLSVLNDIEIIGQ